MTGRDFLDTADRLLLLRAESDWRTATSRAYYGLYLECREALRRWGFAIGIRGSHRDVGQRLSLPKNADLNLISRTFGQLSGARNKADYDLSPASVFASPLVAKGSVADARAAVTLLDAIDADPVRRAQAVADIRTAFP